MISPNTEAPSLLIQLNYSKNNIDKMFKKVGVEHDN